MTTAQEISVIEQAENRPVPPQMKQEYDRLSSLSDDDLQQELATAIALTAAHFIKLAAVVRVMEDRGHDLSRLRIGMLGYLRKIAYGQLLPELLVDYGHTPFLMQRLAALPMPDQSKAYRHGVSVGVRKADGAIDSVKIPLPSLNAAQIRTVFAHDHIRTPEEQVRHNRFERPAIIEQQRQPEPPPYVVNKDRCIVNRPTTLSKRDIQNILKAMG